MKIKEIENGFQVRTNRGKIVRQYGVIAPGVLREIKADETRLRFFIGEPGEERAIEALIEANLTERVECKITMV